MYLKFYKIMGANLSYCTQQNYLLLLEEKEKLFMVSTSYNHSCPPNQPYRDSQKQYLRLRRKASIAKTVERKQIKL